MNSPLNSNFTKNLNLNHLRVFVAVFRTKSMTDAAKELHLTQSGVSQHIKSLESEIGVKLFDRVKQRLVPTQAANGLFNQCMKSLYELESALADIQGGKKTLRGKVTIGVPIEFGNNIIVPLLAQLGAEQPGLRFRMVLGYASDMVRLLLEGRIDFCFIDQYQTDTRITTVKVYEEILDLVISSRLLKKFPPPRNDRKYFETLPYVAYKDDEPLLRMWFKHHFGAGKINLQVRSIMMDVQGVGRFIQNGMGAGILPDHFLQQINKGGKQFHLFKGSGKPLVNQISLASLKERTHSPEAIATMEYLAGKLQAQ